MDRILQKALSVIGLSLGLALVFNFLFFNKAFGISTLIFSGILLGVVFLFGRYHRIAMQKTWWIVALIAFFALMPAIRANESLQVFNILAVLSLLMLLAYQLVGTPAFIMRLRDYLLMVVIPFRMLRRALSTLSLVGQIHSNVQRRDVWVRIVKGVLMALPILIIFALLFSNADLAFSQFLNRFIHITVSESTMQYIVLLCVAFVASLSFLSYIFFPKPTQPTLSPEKPETIVQSGRKIEVLVFLGLIATLFLVFIGFQVTYLFGGEANIINAGFTYAEYARRGFWELLAVALLSLVVLIASEKYAGVESKKDKRFLTPALILIGEVLVVIVSAFKRLSLYIDAYSMTLLRFYVVGFIALLSVLFILLAIKFIQSRREQFFTFGALLSVATFLIVVNLMNPDAFVARSNIEQYSRTGKVDAAYVGSLSVDAESSKVELYNKLQGEEKEIVRAWLQRDIQRLHNETEYWQSANFARSRAVTMLKELGFQNTPEDIVIPDSETSTSTPITLPPTKPGVRSGTVVETNMQEIAYDGPVRIVLESANGTRSKISIPSMGLPLCAAYKAGSIRDPYSIKVGQYLEVSGAVAEDGTITPCHSTEHYLR